MACEFCPLTFTFLFKRVYEDDGKALKIFQDHGVLPSSQMCNLCGNTCFLDEELVFRCRKKTENLHNETVTHCPFAVSVKRGTWLKKSQVAPSVNLLFIYSYIWNQLSFDYINENLGLSSETFRNSKVFCGEVCQYWYGSQPPIGGQNVIVEIGISKFGKRKHHRGIMVDGVWIFSGIERGSKRRFVVGVEKRDKATLVPLIQQFIKPGSIIISDREEVYSDLEELGYKHLVVDDSDNPVDPVAGAHKNNIKKLWLDVKTEIYCPGNRTYHCQYFLARYFFLVAHIHDKQGMLHYFLKQIALMYPPELC